MGSPPAVTCALSVTKMLCPARGETEKLNGRLLIVSRVEVIDAAVNQRPAAKEVTARVIGEDGSSAPPAIGTCHTPSCPRPPSA